MDKLPRPKVLGGITVKMQTGCGNMYIQLNWCGGQLFEIFATLGRSGGCPMCYSEALTRSVTTGLRCGMPVAEYIEQLRNIRCPNSVHFPKEQSSLSCPDTIARALAEYGSLTVDDIIKIIVGVNRVDNPSPESEEKEAMKHIEEQQARSRELFEEQDGGGGAA